MLDTPSVRPAAPPTCRRLVAWALGVALLLGTASLQPAAAQDETVDVGSFTEFEMAVPGTAYLSQGNEQRVQIEAPSEVRENIEAVIEEEGRLVIRRSDDGLVGQLDRMLSDLDTDDIIVRITVTTLEDVTVSGSARVEGESPISADNLLLRVSGSGNLVLQVDADEVTTRVSGSGDMTLRGSSTSHKATITGSGSIRADEMTARTAIVEISGSGDCRLHASETLNASISGSGRVLYRGSPQITRSVSGSGTIRALE
jgi:hypothetical protein